MAKEADGAGAPERDAQANETRESVEESPSGSGAGALLPTSAYFEPLAGIIDKTKPPGPTAPAGYVKGGGAVLTGPYEKQMKLEEADARRRRAERDEEKRIAGIPIDAGGGMEYEHRLATPEEAMLPEGHVLLKHVTSRREPIYRNGEPVEQVGDVKSTDVPAYPGELMLLLFCPRCVERGSLPVDHCILQVRQSNRKWHLDTKTSGTVFLFKEWNIITGRMEQRPYRSMGEVCDSERITCSTCGWACHIDHNLVISE